MSLYWTIESKTRSVTVIAEGAVSHSDIAACRDAIAGARARPYRKLVDARAAQLPEQMDEVVQAAADIRLHDQQSADPAGPLAVVLTVDQRESPLLARFFGILATARRPMRIFSDPAAARRWLDEEA